VAMKSFFKLTTILAALFFIGCGGDDNSYSDNVQLKSISINVDEIRLRVNKTYDITLEGIDSNGLARKLDASEASYSINDDNIATVSYDGKINGISKGNTTLSIKYNDLNSVEVNVIVAGELNTSNINKAYFGNLYINNIPDDSTLETYDEKLFAMITGKVLDDNGKGLKDVTVTIHDLNKYGSTKTDENGSYAIPVEGAKQS
jgi:hypothetical protein